MASDDFNVIVYKLLSYIYECLKKDIEPDLDKAFALAGCNQRYWCAICKSVADDGYVTGLSVREYKNGDPVVFGCGVLLTRTGATFLEENSTMRKVAGAIGKTFAPALDIALRTTAFLG